MPSVSSAPDIMASNSPNAPMPPYIILIAESIAWASTPPVDLGMSPLACDATVGTIRQNIDGTLKSSTMPENTIESTPNVLGADDTSLGFCMVDDSIPPGYGKPDRF